MPPPRAGGRQTERCPARRSTARGRRCARHCGASNAYRRRWAIRLRDDGAFGKELTDCVYCGKPLPIDDGHPTPLDIDHVLAQQRGGTDDFANVVLACRACNRSKGEHCVRAWGLRRLRGGEPLSLRFRDALSGHCMRDDPLRQARNKADDALGAETHAGSNPQQPTLFDVPPTP